MRMAGPDIVLFAVGFVLFGGATYAIVALDGGGGATSAIGVFDVTYTLEEVEVGSTSVAARDGEAPFSVNQTDVVRVLVDVACAGAAGTDVGPATFSLQVAVTGPDGRAGEGSGSCAEGVQIEVPVADPPPNTSVPGTNEAEARANLPRTENATAAQGTWTVTVSGARVGTPGLPGGISDPQAEVTLTVEQARPVFAPVPR